VKEDQPISLLSLRERLVERLLRLRLCSGTGLNEQTEKKAASEQA
jgi:hypothetical protein